MSILACPQDTLGEKGSQIQAKLLEKTGQSTVPNVWINGKFIGKFFTIFC
jgi:glutaredoxin